MTTHVSPTIPRPQRLNRDGCRGAVACPQSHCRWPSLFVIPVAHSQLARSSVVLIELPFISRHEHRSALPAVVQALHVSEYVPCGRRRFPHTSSPSSLVTSPQQSRTYNRLWISTWFWSLQRAVSTLPTIEIPSQLRAYDPDGSRPPY